MVITTIHDLVDYLGVFHRPLMESPALSPAIVPQDLPRPLSELYCGLGGLVEMERLDARVLARPPFAAQDRLVGLRKLKRVDGMIEFAGENQACWSCRTLLQQDNPPVYSDAGACYYQRPGFLVVCDSLSHFLITLSLQEAVMSARVLLAIENNTAAEAVAPVLRPLWLNGKYVFDEPSHNFFDVQNHDMLVMAHSEMGIWVASHSTDVFDFLKPEAKYDRI